MMMMILTFTFTVSVNHDVCVYRGFRHIVSAVPAQQNLASASIVGYKDRMVR